jgi:hypothetical protein
MGAVSWVYRVADGIVLRYPRDVNAKEFGKENDIYDIFEQHPPPRRASIAHQSQTSFPPWSRV